ncbi:MAG: ImmA/IrrE family metallo-endopeptidase, partial [Lentisphaeria bacterium]|nr:ImmA/IrrE family metallo-endopeptidase [Lentisphaeria bacterium]
MKRVEVKPELLRWALERSFKSPSMLENKFPKLDAWLTGKLSPTFKQLETFAKATSTPIGFFFLPEPPVEKMPISDFRTLTDTSVRRPSADLLDTIYTMQRRQDWLREELIDCEAEALDFVGSARLHDDPVAIGQEMRRLVGLGDGWAGHVRTWREAVTDLRNRIDELGVVAVINGVVGNNTHRKLDVEEFRGFALIDRHAPLIFVNGADAKSAQMFTLAHELAHVWLGPEGQGLSGFKSIFPGGDRVEDFCNQAAAEFLVPGHDLKDQWRSLKTPSEPLDESEPFEKMARYFKVSPIVIGRRAMDLRLVTREKFFAFYEAYTQRERQRAKRTKGGGDFYNNQNTRVGARFA